jgi:hypothetical protein
MHTSILIVIPFSPGSRRVPSRRGEPQLTLLSLS